jgi:hypothetical protein
MSSRVKPATRAGSGKIRVNPIERGSHRLAECADEPGRQRACRLYRDLLAEDGAHCQFERIVGARQAQALCTCRQRTQHRRDFRRIGTDVEHLPRARQQFLAGRCERRSKPQLQRMPPRQMADFEPSAPAIADADGAPVRVAGNRLDTRDRPGREEGQHSPEVIGRSIRQGKRQPVDSGGCAMLAAFLAQARRAEAVTFGEQAVHPPHAGKPAGERNLGDRQAGVRQQALGQQQPVRLRIRTGGTPNSSANKRRKWRPVTPIRRATVGRSTSLATPSSIMRAAARASFAPASVAANPGASSGRQRRQGRKPAASAAAALGWNEQFSPFGSRTRQIGRQ